MILSSPLEDLKDIGHCFDAHAQKEMQTKRNENSLILPILQKVMTTQLYNSTELLTLAQNTLMETTQQQQQQQQQHPPQKNSFS